EISKGSLMITINQSILLFDFKKVHTDTVLESNIEPTIQGPQFSFSEDLMTNINIIRHKYHQTSLKVEMLNIGRKSNQSLAVIYDNDLVDKNALKEINKMLVMNESDVVLSSAELLRHLNKQKSSLLPTLLLTERPDRISYNLAGGKVIV